MFSDKKGEVDILFLFVAWNVETLCVGVVQIVLEPANYYPDQFRTTLYFLQSCPAQPDVNPKLSVNQTLEANF